MRKHNFKVRLLSFIALCGIVMAFTACSNEDVAQGSVETNTANNDNLTTFVTGNPATRTSLNYDDGAFFWESGDHIYVKDDNGTWHKSSNAPTEKTASFKFKVPGKYTDHTSYKVYYPGKQGINNNVTISATQLQKTPNSTAHIGDAGDCGTADATGGNGVFNFRLDHQAAILVFQPFTENDAVKNCYLTKIEVTSDNDITNTYTLDTTSGELTGSGSGKTITVTTQGDGSYAQGFPLKTSSANVATNGTYVVIRPGTHALTVRYWIKDYVTQVEGAVTKTYPAFDYEKNDYYDMTANLNVTDYDGRKYYMWDAKNNYWNGHEWNSATPLQPVLKGGTYTKTGDDNFYNNERPGGSKAAMYSCIDLPSANVMAWYVKEGDPHWDGGEVWTTMGHLYKGGMWFKKKLYIPQFSATKAPNPINTDIASSFSDYTLNANPAQGTPTAKALYFFVPALGQYSWNSFGGLGTDGYYWTSSGSNEDGNWAYFLQFNSSNVTLSSDGSELGNYVMRFN
jgi:putative lipoprotein